MGCGQKIWCLLYFLFFVSNLQSYCTLADPQVPCYFNFGDSLSDNGNNNALLTLAKVNFRPYGIDFPTGPTGRFTNGRTIVDVIAERLGFKSYPPAFATARGQEILIGVNYASGAAGIRDESGEKLGDRVTMNEQLRNYQISVRQIAGIQGDNDIATANYLSRCMFTVGIGSNDYINNYFMPSLYQTSRQYTPDQYAVVLIDQYSQQLKTLYEYGARKVAIFGLGVIGCTPGELAKFGASPGSACVDEINDAVQLFNDRLKLLVDDLNAKFSDARFTYINIFSIGSVDATTLGFTVTNTGCCGGRNVCLPITIPCRNRSEYVFWDQFHPSEDVNVFLAGRSYISETPSDAHPIDIHTLAQA